MLTLSRPSYSSVLSLNRVQNQELASFQLQSFPLEESRTESSEVMGTNQLPMKCFLFFFLFIAASFRQSSGVRRNELAGMRASQCIKERR